MKILLITEFFPTGKDLRFSGGVEARTYYIGKNLAKRHTVFVIACRTKGSPKTEKVAGITVYRVGPKRNYSASVGHLFSRLFFIKDAIKFGQELNVEIIDGGNYIAHFISKQISKSKNIPVVAWYPDVWLNNWIKNAGIYGFFGEALERINLKRNFDAYIAISKYTRRKLKKFVNREIQLIYCGVDENETVAKKVKFSEPTILCVSRLAKYKNLNTLLLAFAHLKTKVKNAKLIIIGSGSELDHLKILITNLKINKSVKIMGNLPRKKLLSIYASSHVFCLPSMVEGFGIATIEAAAYGLPYVNSNIAIQKEVTKNGLGGFLVDTNSPLQYSEKFYDLITKNKLYQTKKSQALKLAKFYNWQKISKQTEVIYRSLL